MIIAGQELLSITPVLLRLKKNMVITIFFFSYV